MQLAPLPEQTACHFYSAPFFGCKDFSAGFDLAWETWKPEHGLLFPGGTMTMLYAMETRRLNETFAS